MAQISGSGHRSDLFKGIDKKNLLPDNRAGGFF